MKDFSSVLLSWYGSHKRKLPWRDIKDPYRIWISEIILQQTRVAQGYDYFLRFIKRFPNVRTLAAASQDEVLKYWEGLGYYSRARNLHEAAQGMGGVFPSSYQGVIALKGVGEYTAAAICSFAYNMPYAVVDGNVYRVLARVFGVDKPIDSTEGKKYFAALAQQLLDKKRSGDYNQAIMDFGALQCVPANPACTQCPFVRRCAAHKTGRVALLPCKAQKPCLFTRYFHYIYVKQKGKTWLHKRGPGDVWQGLYEPLLIETASEEENCLCSPRYQHFLGHRKAVIKIPALKHQLSHRIIYADLSEISLPFCWPLPKGYIAVPFCDVKKFALSRLVQKLLEKAALL